MKVRKFNFLLTAQQLPGAHSFQMRRHSKSSMHLKTNPAMVDRSIVALVERWMVSGAFEAISALEVTSIERHSSWALLAIAAFGATLVLEVALIEGHSNLVLLASAASCFEFATNLVLEVGSIECHSGSVLLASVVSCFEAVTGQELGIDHSWIADILCHSDCIAVR